MFVQTTKTKRSIHGQKKGLVSKETVAPLLLGSWTWKFGIIIIVQIDISQITTVKNITKPAVTFGAKSQCAH